MIVSFRMKHSEINKSDDRYLYRLGGSRSKSRVNYSFRKKNNNDNDRFFHNRKTNTFSLSNDVLYDGCSE